MTTMEEGDSDVIVVKNKVKEEWEARNTGISFEDALGPYKNCHGRKRKER